MNCVEAPEHFTEEGKRLFEELQTNYNLYDSTALLVLESLVENWETIQLLRQDLAQNGYVTVSPSGMRRKNPAATCLKETLVSFYQAIKLLKMYIKEPEPEEEPDDLTKFLKERNLLPF